LTQLEEALVEVAGILDQNRVPYMLIGGTALILWGHSRSTLDLDITVWATPDTQEALVDLLSRTLPPRVPDPRKFVAQSRVLPARTRKGIPVDFIFGLLPFEEEAIKRAVDKNVGSARVKVASVEDLILHKAISTRPRDLEDVRFLVTRHGAGIDRARLDRAIQSVAEELSDPGIQQRYRSAWSPQ
jgi:hypothetical protein